MEAVELTLKTDRAIVQKRKAPLAKESITVQILNWTLRVMTQEVIVAQGVCAT